MDFRIAALGELSEHDIDAWRALADAAVEPNANADPRFLMASLGHGIGAEELRLAIVVDDAGAFALVLPFTVGARIAGIRAKHLTTHGAFIHEFASKNHPLVSAHEPAAALGALFDGLRQARFPDLVDFTVLPADSVIADALHELEADGSLVMIERVRDQRAYARRSDLSPDGSMEWYEREDDVLSFPVPHLSSKARRSTGQFGRQIERAAGGRLELTRHDAESGVIEEFLDLQAAGWKGDASMTGPQFRRKGQEAWFRAVTDAFRADDRLRVLRLSAGGRTVYIAVFFESGGRPFGFHDVFDEAFRKSSPGAVGRLAQLGHIMREPDAPPFDPGMEPWYAQANATFPSRREHVNLLVGGRSLRARGVVRLLPIAKRVRDRLRRSAAEAQTVSGGQ